MFFLLPNQLHCSFFEKEIIPIRITPTGETAKIDIGDVVGGIAEPTDPNEPAPDSTASDLLNQAEQLFEDADAALGEQDFATYGEKMKAARDLVAQALDLLDD